MTIDAVLLASFGGPEGPDEVLPFLERVTAGRGIPPERLAVVGAHYVALGGVSPINGQNRLLLACLKDELGVRGVDLPVYWGNRNSAPFFDEALNAIHADGRSRVLAISTSAYSSYSGCRQYRENIAAALTATGLSGSVEVVKAPPYFDRAGFVEPFATHLAEALADRVGVEGDGRRVAVLFTTHSIPDAMDHSSGPDEARVEGGAGLYLRQHLDVATGVMREATRISGVTDVPWRLVFQSRSGPPQMPWLEPDVNDALREVAAEGVESVVLVPIGFVSDHMEVVWDLDHEARATAEGLGLDLVRIPTPGVDPVFVSALVDLIVERLSAPDDALRPGGLCSTTCCRNARADLPVIPGC